MSIQGESQTGQDLRLASCPSDRSKLPVMAIAESESENRRSNPESVAHFVAIWRTDVWTAQYCQKTAIAITHGFSHTVSCRILGKLASTQEQDQH
jgi:hypothetical protein